jgi:hypothetical protein
MPVASKCLTVHIVTSRNGQINRQKYPFREGLISIGLSEYGINENFYLAIRMYDNNMFDCETYISDNHKDKTEETYCLYDKTRIKPFNIKYKCDGVFITVVVE